MYKIYSFRDKNHFQYIDEVIKKFTIKEISFSTEKIKNIKALMEPASFFDDIDKELMVENIINTNCQDINKHSVCAISFLNVENQTITQENFPIMQKMQVSIPMEKLQYNDVVYKLNNSKETKINLTIGDKLNYINEKNYLPTISFPKDVKLFNSKITNTIIPIKRGVILYDYNQLKQDLKNNKIQIDSKIIEKIKKYIKNKHQDGISFFNEIDDLSNQYPDLANYFYVILVQEEMTISKRDLKPSDEHIIYNTISYITMKLSWVDSTSL